MSDNHHKTQPIGSVQHVDSVVVFFLDGEGGVWGGVGGGCGLLSYLFVGVFRTYPKP